MGAKNFTQKEINIIVELYDNGNGLNYAEISRETGRSKTSIGRKLQSLGIAKVGTKRNANHHHEIGDIVGSGTIKIIKQIKNKRNHKAYIVASITYPNAEYYTMTESSISRGDKDSYLSGKRVCEESSLYNKTIAKPFLLDVEQAKTISPHSNKPINFKCPECDEVKKMKPNDLMFHGDIMCKKCPKSLYYGQLAFGQYSTYFNLDFESEKRLPGLPNRRVDFINWENGMWVEIQGEQHTNVNHIWYKDSHAQDLEKRAFAKENTQYNLIEIDMRISSWEYFKEQINKCEYLPNINVEDEKEILKMMENNKRYPIKEIIELYTVRMETTTQIGERFNMSSSNVGRMLEKYNIIRRSSSEAKLKGKVSDEEKIIELYKSGKSSVYIGKLFQVSPQVILNILSKNNIQKRTRGGAKKLPIDDIIKEYQDGMSGAQLGKKYNVSNKTIYNHLKNNNIVKRKGANQHTKILN